MPFGVNDKLEKIFRLSSFIFFVYEFFDDVVDCDDGEESEDDVTYFVRVFVDEIHVVAYDVAYEGKDYVPDACAEGCESDEWEDWHTS